MEACVAFVHIRFIIIRNNNRTFDLLASFQYIKSNNGHITHHYWPYFRHSISLVPGKALDHLQNNANEPLYNNGLSVNGSFPGCHH